MNYIDELSAEMGGLDNLNGVSVQGMRRGAVEKASFAVQVKRLSANIALPLPYAIFGAVFTASGYRDIITVPSGVTMEVVNGIQNSSELNLGAGEYGKTKLIFTEGANVDIVEITTKAAAGYPSLLAATMSDVFDVSKLRLAIAPSTEDSQFDTDLNLVSKTIFGKEDKNPLNIASYKRPDQFQTGIVDIVLNNVGIDKEAAFVGELIEVAGITVTHSFSVSRINKFNRNLLK